MFWIALKLKIHDSVVEKRVLSYENMWPVSVIGDMVHKNKTYGTTPDVAVVNEEEGFDSSLKSDTAQRIIQQWIEVWSSDWLSVSFQQPCELWRFGLWESRGQCKLPALIHFNIFNFI